MFRSQTLGFIFQQFNLLHRTSALDNVILPQIYAGQGHHERGPELLRMVGLSDRMDHKPNQLSGGQQQRVAIARALVNSPQVLFADEPTGNLSSNQSEDILRLLTQLNQQGLTIVLVTHDLGIAEYARRIIRIKDGLLIEEKSNDFGPGEKRSSGICWSVSTRVAIQPIVNSNSPRFSLAELKEHVGSAFRAMTANKIRSALSVLGVSVGG